MQYGYDSSLVDIFTNEVVYFKRDCERIKMKEYIYEKNNYAYITQLYEFNKNILVYPDNKVPLYVLKRIFYQINNIDISNVLEKTYK